MKPGERIKKKRLELGLKQPQLAVMCGWEDAQSRISHYEKGRREPTSEDLIKLASALNVKPSWLLFGDEEDSNPNFLDLPPSKTTVIAWNQASDWSTPERQVDLGKTPEYVPYSEAGKPHLFALKVRDDSMVGKDKAFFVGSYLIVDSYLSPEAGSYIIGIRKGEKEAFFRQYVKDGDRIKLKALNQQYPIEDTKDFDLCGVVIANVDVLV